MIKNILHNISIWIVVLPAIAGLSNYRRLNGDSRWILLLVLLAAIPQLFTSFLDKNNYWLHLSYNLYTPMEFVILYFIFLGKYSQPAHRRWLHVSLLLYMAGMAAMLAGNSLGSGFQNMLVCVNNVVYITWILLLLLEQYDAENGFLQWRNPFAWYLVAYSIYAPCTTPVFALYHYIRNPSDQLLFSLSAIHHIFNILLYLCLTCGLLLRPQPYLSPK